MIISTPRSSASLAESDEFKTSFSQIPNLRFSQESVIVLPASKALSVPILGPLIPDGIASGTMVLVEFDPEGQWFPLSRTISAGALHNGWRVLYGATARPREEAFAALERLGVDVAECERAGRLRVDDYHTATQSLDKGDVEDQVVDDAYVRMGSPRIAAFSVSQLKSLKGQLPVLSKWSGDQSDVLALADSLSPFLRFNDEKAFLEWIETRNLPLNRKVGRVLVDGISRRIHSDFFYARLEAAFDAVVEVRVIDRGEEVKNLLRVRAVKGLPHDSRWHEIDVKPNGEANLRD